MDKVLLDALLEEQQKGNRLEGVFTPSAYANLVQACNEKLGMKFENNHLKNRMKTLKTNFSTCYNLFKGMSVFSWNPGAKMWDAELELRREFLEAKPDARKWMSTPINFYDKSCELWTKDRATIEIHGANTSKKLKRKAEMTKLLERQCGIIYDAIKELDAFLTVTKSLANVRVFFNCQLDKCL
ncbi:hypothetical protein NMG60_11028288 [Bertholletia excelsa]